MDNDQQIKDVVRGTKDHFLSQPIESDSREEVFNLELEFAKTAKNKSFTIPIVTISFFLVMVVGAVVATLVSDQANQQKTVQIGQFNDLNLKDLFDSVKKNQNDLSDTKNQIAIIKQKLSDDEEHIRQDASTQLDMLSVSSLPPDALQKKQEQVKERMAELLAHATASADVQLKPLEEQAKDLQKKIDSYDNRIGKMNKENEERLSSQQKLFDIEMSKLKSYYQDRILTMSQANELNLERIRRAHAEYLSALRRRHAEEIAKLILKYNPKALPEDVQLITKAYENLTQSFEIPPLPAPLAQDGAILPTQRVAQGNEVAQLHRLMAILKNIPFENSVPGILRSLDVLQAETFQGYERLLASTAQVLAAKDAEIAAQKAQVAQLQGQLTNQEKVIAEYNAGWAALVNVNNKVYDGMIVSILGDKQVTIWLLPSLKLKAGEVFSFRDPKDDKELGELKLLTTTAPVTAEITVQKDFFRAPKPWDRLKLIPVAQP